MVEEADETTQRRIEEIRSDGDAQLQEVTAVQFNSTE
jgi:hypothetical protein